MRNDNDIRRGRRCVLKMHVLLVIEAKYRHRVFNGDTINRLRTLFSRTCADFGAQLIEMDGEDVHVHLLVEYPPKVAVYCARSDQISRNATGRASSGGAPITLMR